MTREQALQRVERLKGHLFTDALISYHTEINELSLAVLGKGVRRCNCRNVLSDAVVEIYNHLKNNGKMRNEIKTIMKRGIVIHYKGEIYSYLNITDEVAADYIADYPQNAHFFEVLPPKKKAVKSSENADAPSVSPTAKKPTKTAKNKAK